MFLHLVHVTSTVDAVNGSISWDIEHQKSFLDALWKQSDIIARLDEQTRMLTNSRERFSQ